ncbi:MAG: FCD domain-containing protein [Devosia sp.]|nr:FCD domain-containing protein [Devosia sp.]
MIASGEFRPGDRLPAHRELMLRFGVGRPAVREALFFLQQQGLVEIANGTRARISLGTAQALSHQLATISKQIATTPHGQEHLEQARLLFEAGLAWCAATAATGDDIVKLKAKLDANVAAVGDQIEFIRTDVAFHYELAVITGNPIFLSIHEMLTEWLIDQRTTTFHMPDADVFSVRDHTAIYEAVAARDPARAFYEMASHIQLIGRLYREAKQLSTEILRDLTHDVVRRFEHEKEALWASSFGRAPQRSRKPRKRQTTR